MTNFDVEREAFTMNYYDIKNAKPHELMMYRDENDYNWLMIAAKNGSIKDVDYFLSIGFDENSSNDRETAIGLAYKNRHFDVVLLLLNNNAMFPKEFSAESTQHAGLINFKKITEKFHRYVIEKNNEEIQRMTMKYKHLKHFFSLNTSYYNKSAVFVALSEKQIQSYENLLQFGIRLANNESFTQATEKFNEKLNTKIRDIHTKLAITLHDSHIKVIQGSMYVGHDEADTEVVERLQLARQVIEELNRIIGVEELLKLVARAGGFKIIMDFNNDHTSVIDPTTTKQTHGVFYSTRHIYIGAKGLLSSNLNDFDDVCGILLHELCHFALVVMYKNDGLPYEVSDIKGKSKLDEVMDLCRSKSNNESIIRNVFNSDDTDVKQRAEIIVRVPQLMARYANNQPKLTKLRSEFQLLFDYYEKRVVPEMIRKTPSIELESIDVRQKLFYKEVSGFKRMAKLTISIGLFCIVLAGFIVYATRERTYEWKTMTTKEQDDACNGIVTASNLKVPFCDLYNRHNSSIFEIISSPQLSRLINDRVLDLEQAENFHLRSHIVLKFSNLTDLLKSAAVKNFVNFQGENVTFGDIVGNDSQFLDIFNAFEIRHLILNETGIEIGEKLPEILMETYVQRDWNSSKGEIVKNPEYFMKSLNLLADEAGMGKTVNFKRLTHQVKKLSPSSYVAYVDMKRYTKELSMIKKDPEAISKLNLLKFLRIDDRFDRILLKSIDFKKVVIFWDGFDEISPTYTEIMINIFKFVRDELKCMQWISTRPLYRQRLLNDLDIITSYKLSPLTEEQNEEFLNKLYKSEGMNETEVVRAKEKVYKISSKIENLEDNKIKSHARAPIKSPLLLEMIAEVSINSEIDDVNNFYEIYDKFMTRKMNILAEKYIKDKYNDKIIQVEKIRYVYKYYAIKEITQSSSGLFYGVSNLTLDIERYENYKLILEGILIFDSLDQFKFVHRTFGEFFLAKYAIETFYELKSNVSKNSPKVSIYFLLDMLCKDQFEMVRRFIHGYVKIYKERALQVNTKVRNKLLKIWKDYEDSSIMSTLWPPNIRFSILVDAFSFDKALLREMFSHDKSSKIISKYAIENPQKFISESENLKNITKEFLDGNDVDEFVLGRNQKGKFLLIASEFMKKDLKQNFDSKDYLSKVNVAINFDYNKYQNCSNFQEFYQFFSDKLSMDEKWEVLVENFNINFLKKRANSDEIMRTYNELGIDKFSHKFHNKTAKEYFFNQQQGETATVAIFELICYLTNKDCSSVHFHNHKNDSKAFDFSSYWKFVSKNLEQKYQRAVLCAPIDHSFNLYQASICNEFVTEENFESIRKVYKDIFKVDVMRNYTLGFIKKPFNYRRITEVSNENLEASGNYFVELFKNDDLEIKSALKELYIRQREAYLMLQPVFYKFFDNETEIEKFNEEIIMR